MKKIDFLKSSTSSFFELLKKKKDTLEVSIHGIEISFHLPTPLALRLTQFLPLTWQTTTNNPIQVQWVSPEEMRWPHSLDWNDDKDHQCHFAKFLDFHFVVQRDFAVAYKDPSNLILISPYSIDDGFFNFLRWLLPRKLLLKNQYVIHSSCVVLPSGEAILSSGPSGAGKSTLAKMAADDGLFILGDDMNIVSKKSDHWHVEAAAIGQIIQSPDALDLKFPLKSIFS
ncbi:MAG: hypothetical protein KDD50_02990, partial [Bdellovibrionales bacterium]|nr:hypothetical protein [Bdellovibrionales bacterium]